MERITKQALADLFKNLPKGPLVTMYIPMHRGASPPHMTENQIRTKNAFMTAIKRLRERSDGQTIASWLQNMLDDLLNSQHFWENQTAGMLVCAAENDIKIFHIPMDTEEYVAIDDTFHIAPLLAMMGDAQTYNVLAISQHDPILFSGDRYGLTEVKAGLPTSMEAALNIDENNQKIEQSHSMVGSTGFNGRGGARDPAEADKEFFMRAVDTAVLAAIERQTPLILAGTDTETAQFRAISKHPFILMGTIGGNWSNHPHIAALFEKAIAVLQTEVIDVAHSEALERFERLQGSHPERVATTDQAIADASGEGRIDTLLVMLTEQTADTVQDPVATSSRITFPSDAALSQHMNRFALNVEQSSGQIMNFDSTTLSLPLRMAAILRY